MDTIISEIKRIADTTDDAGRTAIQDQLRRVQYELETPFETTCRLFNSQIELGVTRLAVQLRLFSLLAESDTPVTVDILAQRCGAEPDFLGRILRYLASVQLVSEAGYGKVAANQFTRVLADSAYEGGICFSFDTIAPLVQTLPEYFESTGYRDITDGSNTVFQKAFKTELSAYDWLAAHPDRFASLQRFMTVQRYGDWTSIPALRGELEEWPQKSEAVAFVDIGGGAGQQCTRLKKQLPSLHGRIVLQDLPEVVTRLSNLDGVEVMAYSFFRPQTVKGAKFYYFRTVFHNYPDKVCSEILHNLRPALAPYSRILIDEEVVPETGAHWQETMADLTMMAAFGSKERTQVQWERLIDAAGFRIEQVWRYNWPVAYSIQVVLPKATEQEIDVKT